ncbi:reductive dehalogenase [Chloroflexota bacterium]
MYQVLDSYRRFDQKNNMVYRPEWDPSLHHMVQERQEGQLRQIERGIIGYGLKDFALTSSTAVLARSLGTGINKANSGLTSWAPLSLEKSIKFPEEKSPVTDAKMMTDQIRRVARYIGADLVGITKLDMRWVYSHHFMAATGESKPVEIDERFKYVIVMGLEMNHDMMKTAPSALQNAETLRTYSRMAYTVSAVAQFIRLLGYNAIPALNDTALSVPLAIDAGLGQLGRQGLLITPQFGPRQRLCKVITDLPLLPDHPIEFGVTEFCSACLKCARECPSQAISREGLTTDTSSISNNPGVMKWPLSAEKCRNYWSQVGTNCGICIRVCPFNKGKGLIHPPTRWLVKHAPWVDHTLLWMDDRLGYGKGLSPKLFWNAS